jgi:ABC-2 type transport system permease protein
MENTSWEKSFFKLELKRMLAYRSDFWVTFLGQILFSFIVSYFLWSNIYNSMGVSVLNNFTLNQMIFYYLVAPLMFRSIQGTNIGLISGDIYEGSLNKYLLYPLSYIKLRMTTYFAQSCFYFIQIAILLLIFSFGFSSSLDYDLKIHNILMGFITLIAASFLYFAMSSIVECIAFWADNIWSLGILLRSLTAFLGGAMIPLSFFPNTIQQVMALTPFPYLISFPLKVMIGEVSLMQWIVQMLILTIWFIIFYFLLGKMWKKGNLSYSGVGI